MPKKIYGDRLGLGVPASVIPVSKQGTGATTNKQAVKNLGGLQIGFKYT